MTTQTPQEEIERLLKMLDWPAGVEFTFHDDPGEHDPCYVVMPGGSMIPINHHAGQGVDIARALFIVEACNRHLRAAPASGEGKLREALEAVEKECWSVKCESYPTGGDDADVGWEVISHWQAEPRERVEGRGSTPLKAILDAMAITSPRAREALSTAPADPGTREADRVDAERYRYLRNRPEDTIGKGGVFAGSTPPTGSGGFILTEEDLDRAVDAAMTSMQL